MVCAMLSSVTSLRTTARPIDNRAARRSAMPARRALSVRADGDGPADKTMDIMRKFSEQYAKSSNTYFCIDKSVTAVVIKGLAEHKESLGAPLCPCRHYDDKEAEAAQGFWNCPCVPMRERKECHCMLFLTEDNDFAGEERTITLAETKEMTEGF